MSLSSALQTEMLLCTRTPQLKIGIAKFLAALETRCQKFRNSDLESELFFL